MCVTLNTVTAFHIKAVSYSISYVSGVLFAVKKQPPHTKNESGWAKKRPVEYILWSAKALLVSRRKATPVQSPYLGFLCVCLGVVLLLLATSCSWHKLSVYFTFTMLDTSVSMYPRMGHFYCGLSNCSVYLLMFSCMVSTPCMCVWQIFNLSASASLVYLCRAVSHCLAVSNALPMDIFVVLVFIPGCIFTVLLIHFVDYLLCVAHDFGFHPSPDWFLSWWLKDSCLFPTFT